VTGGLRRTALVTGATGGLGRAIAAQLLADGADLIVTGRNDADLAAVSRELRAGWPAAEITAEACDLSDEAAIRALAERLEAARCRPDILINNAAVQGPIGPFLQASWTDWRTTVAVDLLAPVLLSQLMIPAMVERGWGRVVNISGGGATGPRRDFTAYAVAKTGLVRFGETLAHELAGSGVTVNAVAPGAMNTGMLDEVAAAGPHRAPDEHASAVARQRTGRAPPSRAASLVGWLVSDAAARVTGRLVSAVWDPWERLAEQAADLEPSDIYTLRRIVPRDRGQAWGER
jgi:3-oxoacyl-[acyl-carrier protein] reductase